MAPSNSQAAASLMLRALLLWQSKARKDYLISHCRLAFCTATKIVLAFVSRAAGSTATTWRKSAIEETMFRKVLLSSALIFFCKRYLHDQRHFFFFYLYLHLKPCEKCSFSDGGSRNFSWHNIQRSNSLVFCFLGCVVKFQARIHLVSNMIWFVHRIKNP